MCAITLFACSFSSVTIAAEKLVQDLEQLSTSDGKIVEQTKLDSRDGCPRSNKCYRIKYISDELEVVGFVVTPKTVSRKLPVMIFNRGGNREFGKLTKKSLKYLSFLSSNGYVVLASQYRGSDGGQGQEEYGGADVNDVLNLMPLARSFSFADASKTVMLGFSRGGMMTLLAIKHGIDIKAAAIVSGVTDIEQTYNDRGEMMRWVIGILVGMNKEDWRKRSALYWPEEINVPLLILHGKKDSQVDVSQAKNLAEKLKEHGKVHKLVVIKRGDHGLNTHRRERNWEIIKWFEKYLR